MMDEIDKYLQQPIKIIKMSEYYKKKRDFFLLNIQILINGSFFFVVEMKINKV